MKFLRLLPALALCAYSYQTSAQTTKVEVPDWALPGSPTHKQVPPPLDFHRPVRTENKSIGIFNGQSDVGSALVPGADPTSLCPLNIPMDLFSVRTGR